MNGRLGVARNVFPVGTNIGTLVPLIGSYQYSHSVFGCAVTTKLVPPLSVDEYAPLAPDWRSTGALLAPRRLEERDSLQRGSF